MSVRALRQPHAALADLCDGFFADVGFLDRCPRIGPEDLTATQRELLVHREHMTTRLAAFYGSPVQLRVLEERRDAGEYARKIVLTPSGSDRVLELGIVRLQLDLIDPSARDEILAKRQPLGDILMRRGILRRISPRWYFRFPADTPIATAFGAAPGPTAGRVGTIYCDEAPAIELLEVVADGSAACD